MSKATPFVVIPGTNRATMVEVYTKTLVSKTERLKEFTDKMLEDPAYHLTFGDKLFVLAAEISVTKQVLHCFKDGATLEQIREYLTDNVMSGARYPASSTSQSNNIIKQQMLAAHTEALQALRHEAALD